MAMSLNEYDAERAYNLLFATLPFVMLEWALPAAHNVRFRRLKSNYSYGTYRTVGGSPVIRINFDKIGTLQTLLMVMAHEMIHLSLKDNNRIRNHHGHVFQARAKLVCDLHGFDYKFFI